MTPGRKSAAANLVSIDVNGRRPKLTPPQHLTTEERWTFNEIVNACDRRQLLKIDTPLLALYAQAVNKARRLCPKADKASEWEKACRVAAMLARSLRLTPQSRLDKAVAGRMARDGDNGVTSALTSLGQHEGDDAEAEA
jgi:hypothetical protein